jgi:hypothetical protein
MEHDKGRGQPHTADREDFDDLLAGVRSIQWVDQPRPAVKPDWRWRGALALAGATAFTLGMAIITDGFQPVTVSPAPGALVAPGLPPAQP